MFFKRRNQFEELFECYIKNIIKTREANVLILSEHGTLRVLKKREFVPKKYIIFNETLYFIKNIEDRFYVYIDIENYNIYIVGTSSIVTNAVKIDALNKYVKSQNDIIDKVKEIPDIQVYLRYLANK